jgi:hypothetical protein
MRGDIHEQLKGHKGGVVVVTRFQAKSRFGLIYLRFLHRRVNNDVQRASTGYLGGKLVTNWREKYALSVTLWSSLEDIYDMGGVGSHIIAARRAGNLGLHATASLFPFWGGWSSGLYGGAPSETSALASE